MQADNLRPQDLDKLRELFGKIKEENPMVRFIAFQKDQFKKKDCLFKDKCKH